MAERICSIRGCKQKHHGRGLCRSHFAEARKTGSLPPVQLSLELSVRHSLSNIDKEKRSADCAACGPGVQIRVRDDRRRPVECRGAAAVRVRRRLARQYGLTESELEAMRARQGGRCAICGQEQKFLNIDHDHVSGKVRGLLCKPCNLGLGHFKDRLDVVIAAASYLGKYS